MSEVGGGSPAGLLPQAALLLGLLVSTAAAFAALWIVLPAPHPMLALVALVAGEAALYLTLSALGGLALCALALRLAESPMPAAWLGIALSSGALVLSLVPPLQAAAVARQQGVSLVPSLDPAGLSVARSVPPPQTHPFARLAGQDLLLDVWQSASPVGPPRPALVVVHGGSWQRGERGEMPHWNRWLASLGYVIFDIQYRLAPQPNWQSATADVKCAVGWVRQHADQFGVDPARIALLGRSAGGHLALLAAYSTHHPALPPSCAPADTSVRAVVGLYAPTDLTWGYQHPANQWVVDGPATLRALLGGSPQQMADVYRLASPTTHVGPATPPTLLLTGAADQYVRSENTARLAHVLARAGVPHQAVVVPHAQHGFDYFLHGWGGQIARQLVQRFLAQYL